MNTDIKQRIAECIEGYTEPNRNLLRDALAVIEQQERALKDERTLRESAQTGHEMLRLEVVKQRERIEQQEQQIEQLTRANELLKGKLTPQQWLPSGSDIEAFQPNEAKTQ